MNRARAAALLRQLSGIFAELATEFDEPRGEGRHARAEAAPVQIDEVTREKIRRILISKGYRELEPALPMVTKAPKRPITEQEKARARKALRRIGVSV